MIVRNKIGRLGKKKTDRSHNIPSVTDIVLIQIFCAN